MIPPESPGQPCHADLEDRSSSAGEGVGACGSMNVWQEPSRRRSRREGLNLFPFFFSLLVFYSVRAVSFSKSCRVACRVRELSVCPLVCAAREDEPSLARAIWHELAFPRAALLSLSLNPTRQSAPTRRNEALLPHASREGPERAVWTLRTPRRPRPAPPLLLTLSNNPSNPRLQRVSPTRMQRTAHRRIRRTRTTRATTRRGREDRAEESERDRVRRFISQTLSRNRNRPSSACTRHTTRVRTLPTRRTRFHRNCSNSAGVDRTSSPAPPSPSKVNSTVRIREDSSRRSITPRTRTRYRRRRTRTRIFRRTNPTVTRRRRTKTLRT